MTLQLLLSTFTCPPLRDNRQEPVLLIDDAYAFSLPPNLPQQMLPQQLIQVVLLCLAVHQEGLQAVLLGVVVDM